MNAHPSQCRLCGRFFVDYQAVKGPALLAIGQLAIGEVEKIHEFLAYHLGNVGLRGTVMGEVTRNALSEEVSSVALQSDQLLQFMLRARHNGGGARNTRGTWKASLIWPGAICGGARIVFAGVA